MPPTSSNAVNKDEEEAPTWLDEKFFIKVLECYEKSQDIAIKNLELKPATAKNEHYASIMFRIIIDYYLKGVPKTISMILKTMPEMTGHKKESLEKTHIFETEIGIYTEVIPKFEAILRAAGDTTKLGPTCIYHSLSPKKLIIFEDLATLGYKPLGKQKIHLNEIKAAYTKLAKWHAVSFKLITEHPNDFDAYRHGIMNSTNLQKSELLKTGLSNFIEMLGAHEDLLQYKPYFMAMSTEKIQKRCIDAFEEFWKAPNVDAYYALCHGDFHRKNFMLQYDAKTGHLKDLMLLDYQFSYVGPIVNDIIYSIYMMLDAEHRSNNWSELLYLYFTHFQLTLERIGYQGPMPKIMEFHKQILQRKSFSIFLLTSFMPISYAFKNDDFDPEDLRNSKDRQKIYKNQHYLKDVRELLPKLLYQGYLEDE